MPRACIGATKSPRVENRDELTGGCPCVVEGADVKEDSTAKKSRKKTVRAKRVDELGRGR